MYINDKTQEQREHYRLSIPYASVPKDGTPVIAKDWYLVNPTSPSAYDIYTQKAQAQSPTKIGDTYSEVWDIVTLPDEQIASNLSEALEFAKTQVSEHVASLIAYAHMNPSVGETGTVERHMAQLASRANKFINGIDKSAQDKTRDNAFFDYQDSLIDAEDGVLRAIVTSLPAKDLYALEIDKVIAWPMWSPPV